MRYLITGWGGRIRTSAWRNQNPLPYRLATPQWRSLPGCRSRPPDHAGQAATALGGKNQDNQCAENSSAASHNERRPLRFAGLAQSRPACGMRDPNDAEARSASRDLPWRATKTESRAHQNPLAQKTQVTAGRCLEIADLLARI